MAHTGQALATAWQESVRDFRTFNDQTVLTLNPLLSAFATRGWFRSLDILDIYRAKVF